LKTGALKYTAETQLYNTISLYTA